ncbi:MAG: CheR family methyltransferase [Candidatus Omnitrophota bacterium]
MSSEKIIFPQELKNRLKTFIASRSGLYFKDHDLRNLEDAVCERMRSCGFDSVLTYYSYITASEKKEDEFRELLNLLTINHTYFFRNKPHFKTLKERILPEIIKKKTQPEIEHHEQKRILRIWSAGCSSGEEPYSIAMTIQELMQNLDGWQIQILATDASTKALEKARKGIYDKKSVKHVSKEYLEKYFVEKTKNREDVRYEIQDTIRNMVSFAEHNLIAEKFPMGFDIIFCRNVVIYFELETTIKIWNKFYSSLNDQGCLFVGYSETLQFIFNKFKMVSWEDAIYYNKKEKVVTDKESRFRPSNSENELENILEDLAKKELEADIKVSQKRAQLPPKHIEDILVQTIKSLRLKDYPQAISLTNQVLTLDKNMVEAYYFAAEVYVNQANFNQAKERLCTLLKLNSLFAPAHYLFGCIYVEEGIWEEAKQSFRKAIYIDQDFLLAHFYLAQGCKNEGRTDGAIREYRNTLKILSKFLPDDIIAYSSGFTAGAIMNVCRDNIERLKRE